MTQVSRVTATPATLALLVRLEAKHGLLMFHQSGGCCDGSAPMCFPRGEFMVGAQDVYLGSIGGTPFYMGAAQFGYWQHTQLIIDVIAGNGGMFSVEGAEGMRFITRSRLFSDEEWAVLSNAGPPPRADIPGHDATIRLTTTQRRGRAEPRANPCARSAQRGMNSEKQ